MENFPASGSFFKFSRRSGHVLYFFCRSLEMELCISHLGLQVRCPGGSVGFAGAHIAVLNQIGLSVEQLTKPFLQSMNVPLGLILGIIL